MRLIRSKETTLRQYVLGELRDRPRLEIEERLITDPEIFEALGVAEAELAEEYLEDTLSSSDKTRFEQHYLVDRERHRHLAFIRMIKSYASAAPRVARGAESSDWRRISDLVRFHPAWAIAAAAMLFLLIGGNLWFVMWNYTLQGQLDQVRAQQGVERQLRQQLQGQVTGLTAQANALQGKLELQPGSAGQLPTFELTPGLLRSSGALARIAVPPGAQFVRLQLRLTSDNSVQYRAVLHDSEGNDVWFQSKLVAESTDGRATVTVHLPAQVLTRGDYQIRLSGTSTPGTAEVAATYTLRVTTP